MRKKVRSETEKIGQLISQAFPPVKLAVGYGSAFFKQKSYEHDKVVMTKINELLDNKIIETRL